MYIFFCHPSTMEKTEKFFSQFWTEKSSIDFHLPFLPILALFINICLVTINWDDIIEKFLRRFKPFFQSRWVLDSLKIFDEKSLDFAELSHGINKLVSVDNDEDLRREDVRMVMGRLGLFCSSGCEGLEESFGCDEFSRLFEEKEPSLEEVKEAFDVFDENKDGFIDAKELQRVLRLLGLKQRSEIDDCKRMIKTVDVNRDGKIDFNEFVKFMESIFC